MTWEELYARAMLLLDDNEVEQESKRKEVAKKKLARAGLEEAPVNIARVQQALIEYSKTKRYLKALETAGTSKDEMNLAYDLWPESKTVYEYVQRMRDRVRSQEMDEVVDIATDKMKTLLQDDNGKCLVNAKLVMKTLERLDRKRFGENDIGAPGVKETEKEPIVYQITNVQLNLHGSEAVKRAFPAGGVVDVEAVVKALEMKADG